MQILVRKTSAGRYIVSRWRLDDRTSELDTLLPNHIQPEWAISNTAWGIKTIGMYVDEDTMKFICEEHEFVFDDGETDIQREMNEYYRNR